MDCLLTNEALSTWLLQYGSGALFILLFIGIIALPVPEETMMILSGILMSQGKMIIPSTLFASYAGAICGITMSYVLGHTAGHFLIVKYGSWIGITPNRFKRVESWFIQFGKWTLLIGYFIPGIRHLTGFSCGITMKYKDFAPFAYAGAVIWVSTFLSLGYFFSDYCFTLFETIEENLEITVVLAVLMILTYGLYLVHSGSKSKNK